MEAESDASLLPCVTEVQRREAQQVWCSERQTEEHTVQLCGEWDLAGPVLSDLI